MMSAPSERYDSLCHYNLTANSPEVDPDKDCGAAAVWHLLGREGASGGVECYQACDAHLGRALLLDGVEEYHEFGSACGLPGSRWVFPHGTCHTEEDLVLSGLAWYEIGDVSDKPSDPLPGTYVRELDTDSWFQFSEEGLWIKSTPAPGVRV